MSKAIFITGTGTDIGKTFVSALIIKKLKEKYDKVGYYKAALSGIKVENNEIIAADPKYVSEIANIKYNINEMVSYVYKDEVSPHLAANLTNNQINLEKIESDFKKNTNKFDYVCMEGSGGIVCPLRMDKQTILLEDVIKRLKLDIIIVSNSGLGAINSTVLTVSYLKHLNISIKGIIMNNYDENNIVHKDNLKQIEFLTDTEVIACVAKDESNLKISNENLEKIFKNI